MVCWGGIGECGWGRIDRRIFSEVKSSHLMI